MKKLSLLIAMILCITIGGVYATWFYSGAENVADVSEPVTINLEDAQTVGSHGSYTLLKSLDGETFFRIDQADENHNAKIVCKGTMKLVFTPAVHASAEIKNGEFDTWVYFSGNFDQLLYNGDEIFVANTKTNKDTGIKVVWVKNDETGNLEYDLTPDIQALVQLNQTITLDTLVDYNAFAAAIEGINLTVHVTDGIIADAPSAQ